MAASCSFRPDEELGKDSVHERQKAEFTATALNNCNDLVGDHGPRREQLVGAACWLSSHISSSSSASKPRIALELRRIGFASVFANQWPGMIDRIVKIAEKLN